MGEKVSPNSGRGGLRWRFLQSLGGAEGHGAAGIADHEDR
jgi:hypothetical protein